MRGIPEPLTTLKGNNVEGYEEDPQETPANVVAMLTEFSDIIDPKDLPNKLSQLKWHITGFVDGDGSFPIILSPEETKKFGWLIQPRFELELRSGEDSETMLRVVCRAVGIKPKILTSENYVKLIVTNRRLLLEKVVPFFEKYRPVIKWRDFKTMSEVAKDLHQKKHLTYEGFKEIIRKIYSLPMNGESRRKWRFSDIIQDEEPPQHVEKKEEHRFPRGLVPLKHYVAGFIDAEGSLGFVINKETKSITPYLTITSSETVVLQKIRWLLGCGEISTGRLQIYGVDNFVNSVAPFLDRQKLIAKRTTYKMFKQILETVVRGDHKRNWEETVAFVKMLNKKAGGSSETIRRASSSKTGGEDMVQHP